jgi:hypothetical protein
VPDTTHHSPPASHGPDHPQEGKEGDQYLPAHHSARCQIIDDPPVSNPHSRDRAVAGYLDTGKGASAP